MNVSKNSRLFGGLLLILIGLGIFLIRTIQIPAQWSSFFSGWPMILVGIGFGLLVLGLLLGSPDMSVPASIMLGLGGIFLYQNSTNEWESWSYVWSLIPGFVGIGIIISGLLKWRIKEEVREGLRLLLISAVLFIIFGSLLGGIKILGNLWPIVLILLGLWIIVRNLIRK